VLLTVARQSGIKSVKASQGLSPVPALVLHSMFFRNGMLKFKMTLSLIFEIEKITWLPSALLCFFDIKNKCSSAVK